MKESIHKGRTRAVLLLLALLLPGWELSLSQAITIDSKTGEVKSGSETVFSIDRRYQQIQATKVDLPAQPMGPAGRTALIRALQAEQGFAMRPFPKGHKGLTLAANGALEPAGESYLEMVTNQGMSAKAGDRLVITDLKIEHGKIILDLNGGPDKKHRFLRHLQIGMGPSVSPVVRDDEQEPSGSRLTLTFNGEVPEVNGAQVKALLAPLISFDTKTPIQAFTDTLPSKLRDAILQHQVMVGMTVDMVLFAKGRPETKSREMEGQMPFEEWIYGKPPQPIEFIRINGNRVIRVAVARQGEKPQVMTQDEVTPLMVSRDDAPTEHSPSRTIGLGDTERDPERQAPATPPSLARPGEAGSESRPVRFPSPKPAATPQPTADSDEESSPR